MNFRCALLFFYCILCYRVVAISMSVSATGFIDAATNLCRTLLTSNLTQSVGHSHSRKMIQSQDIYRAHFLTQCGCMDAWTHLHPNTNSTLKCGMHIYFNHLQSVICWQYLANISVLAISSYLPANLQFEKQFASTHLSGPLGTQHVQHTLDSYYIYNI